MACRVKDVEKKLSIALKKLENCVEYLTLTLSRDGVDNPSIKARENCYSRYGKSLSHLTMLSEFVKLLETRKPGDSVECYFDYNGMRIEIGDGSHFYIEEPIPVSEYMVIKIRSLSKEGLDIIDMITEAALKSGEPLTRSGVLYMLFLLDFENIERDIITLIRSYGFLDTRYYGNTLESLGYSGHGYSVYDLVRIVDLRSGSLVSIGIEKKPS